MTLLEICNNNGGERKLIMTKAVKQQHTTPHGAHAWASKKSGSSRASKVFDTKAEAVAYSRQVAQNQNIEHVIHGRDGKIQSRDSYGKDPYPPKG